MKNNADTTKAQARPNHLIWISCLIPVLIVGFACLAPVVFPQRKYTFVTRTSYTSVAEAFAYALINNDASAAKSFAAITQWNRLDLWTASRAAFSCPFVITLDEMEGEVAGGVGTQNENRGQAHYSFGYQCTHEDYALSVDDIQLVLQENGEWQIIDWAVCEKRKYRPEKCG